MFCVNLLTFVVAAMTASLLTQQGDASCSSATFNDTNEDFKIVHIYNGSLLIKKSRITDLHSIHPHCPDFSNTNYLEQKTCCHQRSISPYRYIINRDYNRDPQDITETECLCRGCIYPGTKKEIINGYKSVNITTNEWVRYWNNGSWRDWKKINITYGCRCDKE